MLNDIMNQPYQLYKDEVRTFTFYAREATSLPIDLAGATVALAAPNSLGTFKNLTGTILDPTAGSFSVEVDPTLDGLLVGMNLPVYCIITNGSDVRIVSIPDGLNVLERGS